MEKRGFSPHGPCAWSGAVEAPKQTELKLALPRQGSELPAHCASCLTTGTGETAQSQSILVSPEPELWVGVLNTPCK